MRTYTQLTREQRYQIYALLKVGHNQTEIAHFIRVHKSTVSRELRRNRGLKGYRPKQAHELALSRCCKAKPLIDPSTWALIEFLIRLDWSPEQVSGWLQDNYGLQISHEWIYQYILTDKHAGGDLHRHLRCQSKILTREALIMVQAALHRCHPPSLSRELRRRQRGQPECVKAIA